eukprot:254811_1
MGSAFIGLSFLDSMDGMVDKKIVSLYGAQMGMLQKTKDAHQALLRQRTSLGDVADESSTIGRDIHAQLAHIDGETDKEEARVRACNDKLKTHLDEMDEHKADIAACAREHKSLLERTAELVQEEKDLKDSSCAARPTNTRLSPPTSWAAAEECASLDKFACFGFYAEPLAVIEATFLQFFKAEPPTHDFKLYTRALLGLETASGTFFAVGDSEFSGDAVCCEKWYDCFNKF